MATPPTLRALANGVADTGQSLSCEKPPGVVQGDLLVAIYVADRDGTQGNIPALPSGGTGWTETGRLGTFDTTGDLRVWHKVAGSTEPAEYGFGTNSLADTVVTIVAYQAGTFSATTPIGEIAFLGNSTASTLREAPSVTGVIDGTLLCGFATGDSASATRSHSGYTTGLVELADYAPSGWVALATAHQVGLTSTDATGTKTCTCTDSSRYLGVSVMIKPDVVVNLTRTPADTAAAGDAVVRSVGRVRTGTETAAATDAATALLGKGRLAASAAAAGDAYSTQRQVWRDLADAAPTVDTVSYEFTRAEIEDYQFVIPVEPHVPFGLGQTVVVERFAPGSAELRSQDRLSPMADVRWFGTDQRTPPTWEFDLYTDVGTPEDALAWAQSLEEVWDAEDLRETPNAVVPLRYKVAGRIRRVYGRPGNFTLVPNYIRTGRVSIVADFRLAENVYYDDTEDTLTVRTVAGVVSGTGFTFPLTFPLTIGAAGDSPRVEQARVRGHRPTWVDVTFHGPCTDPWVSIGGRRWGLRGTVLPGTTQRVRMSGKPWQQGIYRADGVWLPGMLDPRARLSQLRLTPGVHDVRYGAHDPTGSSYATLAWRPANGTM